MSDIGFSSTSFTLLKSLHADNSKTWMEANREAVKEHLQAPFAFMLDCVTRELSDHDLRLSGSKKTMFRLHRDIRFSKDKRPYNTHVSGLLTPSGTKSEKDGVVYAQLTIGGGFLAVGYYGLGAKELAPLRDKILEKSDEFKYLLSHLEQHNLALNTENTLSSMPRGYSQYADHDYATYLKLKSFIIRSDLKESDWYETDMVKRITDFARITTPVIEFGRV